MAEPLAPIGPELRRQNRRLIAERTGWPAGAVEACESIDEKFPQWFVSYRHENTNRRFERPAGFYATRERSLDWPAACLYGATAEALVAAIEAHSEADGKGW